VRLDSSLSGALSVRSSRVSVHLKLIDAVRPQVSDHGRRQWTVIDVQHSTGLLQRVSHITHRRVVDTIASHHAYTHTHVCVQLGLHYYYTADEDWMMIRMVGGWAFLLVPAHTGSPRQRAVQQLLYYYKTRNSFYFIIILQWVLHPHPQQPAVT